jgi:hypothetical protein
MAMQLISICSRAYMGRTGPKTSSQDGLSTAKPIFFRGKAMGFAKAQPILRAV